MTARRDALRWVERTLGARVIRADRLRGGVSSIVHRLHTDHRNPELRQLILRRIDRPDQPDEARAEIENEVAALDVVRAWTLAPDLVDADPTGTNAGAPSSLQTMLPGRPTPAPRNIKAWVDGLADSIVGLHVPRREFRVGRLYSPWWPSDGIGEWAATALTQDLVSVAHEAVESAKPEALVHRDLHPMNVLFHQGRLSGVVDWPNAAL